ncbi:MAG: hypothetical protein WCX65_05120 [bacterium]
MEIRNEILRFLTAGEESHITHEGHPPPCPTGADAPGQRVTCWTRLLLPAAACCCKHYHR